MRNDSNLAYHNRDFLTSLLDNKLGLRLIGEMRKAYSGKAPSASQHQSIVLSELEKSPGAFDLQGIPAENYVKQLLLGDSPYMISRFGSTEMSTILTYLNMQDDRSSFTKLFDYIKGDMGCFLSYNARAIMHLSGIFPNSKEITVRFSEQMLQDMRNIDLLGSWLSDDSWLQKQCFPTAVRVPLGDIEPFRSKQPWSSVLEGKLVLVVHPFEESIRKQYFERRSLLFKNEQMLPKFELKTLKAVQTIAGNSAGFSDWFEAFDYMCDRIAKIDFDIAIIGAGGYGLPLASFIKAKLAKKAVHLGGATQIMFGVKGRKWVENPAFDGLFNEHWISPSHSETPSSFKRVEGGCYW